MRDEWSVTDRTARGEAQAAGAESPVVHVFLPRRSAEDIKKAIASYEAATEVLSGRPVPTTHEGREARAAMEFRQRGARTTLDATIDAVLRNARVLQGGGNDIPGGSLRDMVAEAGSASLDRMYPRFTDGDNARWHLIVKRAREGGGDPLSALGYSGEPEKHPACRDILTFVGPGKKGREVRARYETPPYGWPRDAVDGSLLALLSAGVLRAASNGVPAIARDIDQGRIGAADFRSETVVFTAVQRIAVRKLFAAAGMDPRSNEEAHAAPQFVAAMLRLAGKTGGEAPLPEPPDLKHLHHLHSTVGNELLVGIYELRERLQRELGEWKELSEKASARLPAWQRLRRLLRHAEGLSEAADLQHQASAVERERALLEDPDPVPPLLAHTTDTLRAAVTEAHERYAAVFDAGLRELEGSDPWQAIGAEEKEPLLRANGLARRDAPRLKDPAAILDSLDATSLSDWNDLTDALSERFSRALRQAAKLLEPKAVHVSTPHANLSTEEEVDDYLGGLRTRIMQHVSEGRPVIL